MHLRPLALLGIVLLGACSRQVYVPEPVPTEIDARSVVEDGERSEDRGETALPSSTPVPSEPASLPAELNLKAAFYPQAPDADWSLPWQEACEEASVLLAVNAVLDKQWTRAQFRQQILDIVAYENETFGDYEHTNVQQTAQMLEHLGVDTVIHENPSYEDLQAILAKGHFIVATFSGKELGNPFYSNGGPTYHAMLIKGYTAGNKVIVHDVGTKRGENYVYSWATIQRTLHDYAEPISEGEKRFIEVVGR